VDLEEEFALPVFFARDFRDGDPGDLDKVRAGALDGHVDGVALGGGADLIKIAMVHIAKIAREENWKSKLLLQVHDELVFDLYLPEKARVLEVVQDRMKNAMPDLKVPIVVDTGLGANWLEAH
jgi:DNA polymerase-1